MAVKGERRSCDRLLTPSRRKWSSRRSASHWRRSVASIALKPAARRPNSSRAGTCGMATKAGSAAPPESPSRDTASTASLSRRSGRVTAAMIHAASSVASSTTPTTAARAGLAKLLPSACAQPAGSVRLWHTR